MIESISPKSLQSLHDSGKPIELLDVRTPAEFREVHIEFAKNLPLDQLDVQQVKASRNASSGELYVVCRSGGRSRSFPRRASPWSMSKAEHSPGRQPVC